jgi:hypothetical protein
MPAGVIVKSLLLSDLKLGLADLLGARAPLLLATAAGRLYHPTLSRHRAELDALPPMVIQSRPLAEELATTDGEHDAFGAAIWFYLEAIARAPDVPADIKARAEHIRTELVPTLSILKESYASEAAGATERRPKIATLQAELEQMPLPGKRTLADWAEAFVGKGEALLTLLTRRATLTVEQEAAARTRAGTLRSETIATLTRFRTALADELADRPAFARERDREIFAFLDQLAGDRQAAQRNRSTPAEPEPGAPEGEIVDPSAAIPVPPAILPTG